MKVKYKIYEVLDTKDVRSDKEVSVLKSITLDFQYEHDSFEEAVETLSKHGNDFKEYTILPRIYKTPY